MTDDELIGYAQLHCQTERALFSSEHVDRLLALAKMPASGLVGFVAVHEAEMTTLIEAIELARVENMVLRCPNCGRQHLDVLEADGKDWSKIVHRTHLCSNTPAGPNTGCGSLFRPKSTPTRGVLTL